MTDLKSDYSDFSPGHIVCEIRYPGAYLIFDRTGSIWHALKLRFPTLSVVFGSPQQTSFKADSYTFNVEAEIARVSCSDPVSVDIEAFQDRCSFFFPLVLGTLEIVTLSRAGLRQFLVKRFATKAQGRTFLKRFNAAGDYIPRWIGEEESNTEVLYHWQSERSVVMVRMGMQPGVSSVPGINLLTNDSKDESAVFLDLDYYITGDIRVDQWSAPEWISQTRHAAKKDVNHFLEEWQ